MFSNSFLSCSISENQNSELFVLCQELRNNKLKNSPWTPFFAQNERLETNRDLYNVFEISEESVDEPRIEKCDGDPSVTVIHEEEAMCVDAGDLKKSGVLDQVLEEQLWKLKETLLDIKKDYPPHQCCPEVAVFNSISPCQVPFACEVLQLSNLSEIAIAVVLNSLSLLEPTISLITAASIIHHAVYSRMKNWTSDTSRALTTGIMMFTKKYPKAVIDELLLPYLRDESFDASQADLLQDVIRNGLPHDQVLYCLRECMEISSPNENTLTTVHCLIERKVHMDDNLCHTLTERICNWSTAFNSSVKFSKLLKSIVCIYGTQLTEEQLSDLNIVVMNNTTFTKRSIENLIKKLSGKHVKSA